MIRAAIACVAIATVAAGVAFAQSSPPAGSTVSAPVNNTGNPPKLLHVYTDAKGETHLETIAVSPKAGELP